MPALSHQIICSELNNTAGITFWLLDLFATPPSWYYRKPPNHHSHMTATCPVIRLNTYPTKQPRLPAPATLVGCHGNTKKRSPPRHACKLVTIITTSQQTAHSCITWPFLFSCFHRRCLRCCTYSCGHITSRSHRGCRVGKCNFVNFLSTIITRHNNTTH